MALQEHQAFWRLEAQLEGDPAVAQSAAAVSLRLVKRIYWSGDPGDRIPESSYEPVHGATWADVFAVTTTATLESIKAAVDAELAGRT